MYIYKLAFLLIIQSFVACQRVQENAPPLEAKLAFQSLADSSQEPEKATFPATNIVFQSIDGGQTWQDVSTGLPGNLPVESFFAQNGEVFLGSPKGLYRSQSMVESDGVLICTNEHGILRSTDSGEHWDLVISEGGVGIAVEVIEGGFAAITYNTQSETRRVRISADGGKTWQPIDAGLPPHASIASIKQVGEYFFCGHPDGIFRSADRGKTWHLVLPTIKDKVFNLSVSGKVIYAIPRNGGC